MTVTGVQGSSEPGTYEVRPANVLVHDVNNLLTAIMVYSGLLASRAEDNAHLRDYAEKIRAYAERAAQLVTQLNTVEQQNSKNSPDTKPMLVARRGSSGH